MRTDITTYGMTPVGAEEAAFILGGVDKRAQDALYTIGYVIGVLARFFVKLFTFGTFC